MAVTLSQAVDIINESLHTLGYDYQIDKTSDDTIDAGLRTIGAYAPSQRSIIMEQMNLVVQQRNYGVMFDATKNKFRDFVIGMTDEGFGVEDVFHELIEGIQPLWDDTSSEADQKILRDLVSYDDNKIHKAFHTNPMAHQVKTTIDRRNYEKVFTRYGVTRYVDTKLANMQWSMEVYLMQQAIAQVQEMIANQHIVFYDGGNVNTPQGVTNFVEKVKAVSNGFLTPNSRYNVGVPEYEAGTLTGFRAVTNMTDSADDIFIVTTPEFFERLKVQGYSNAFNLSQYELEGRVLFVPAGTNLGTYGDKTVELALLDRRAILLGIRMWAGSSKFIENVHRLNNWLTMEGIKGYNTFFNAVAFYTDTLVDISQDVLPVSQESSMLVAVWDQTDSEAVYSFSAPGMVLFSNDASKYRVYKFNTTSVYMTVNGNFSATMNGNLVSDGVSVSAFAIKNGDFIILSIM